jgi:hypothetical protein
VDRVTDIGDIDNTVGVDVIDDIVVTVAVPHYANSPPVEH